MVACQLPRFEPYRECIAYSQISRAKEISEDARGIDRVYTSGIGQAFVAAYPKILQEYEGEVYGSIGGSGGTYKVLNSVYKTVLGNYIQISIRVSNARCGDASDDGSGRVLHMRFLLT